MEKYSLEKYRRLIESVRWYGALIIGLLMAFQLLNLIAGLSIALALGLADQIFVKPKLKPKK